MTEEPEQPAEAVSLQAGSSRRPSQESFPRTARLLKHSDFDRVYKLGKRHFSPHMTIYFLRRAEHDAPAARVGFTVGKVLGGAVDRNRMKRRLREAVRRRLSLFQQTAADVVINPKKSVLTLEFETLLEEVGRAIEMVRKKMS
jgi:ribonuclease P protein component